MQPVRYLGDLVSARSDGRTAGVSRVIVGAAAFLQAIDSAYILSAVLDETKLQIPHNSWLPVISGDYLPVFILLWCVVAIAFTIGWRTRAAGTLLAGILAYSIVLDQQAYSNHVYLLILVVVLLMMADCGNRYSIDALVGRQRESTPQWPIGLLKIQVSIVYFFAAVSKVNALYISGAIMAANMREAWLLRLPEAWLRLEIMLPLALLSIFTESFLALAFWSKRYRHIAFCLGLMFHTAIVLTFPIRNSAALVVFGIVMLAMYVPFIDPEKLLTKVQAVWSIRYTVFPRHLASPAEHDSTRPG